MKIQVSGSECLNYVDKPIGWVSKGRQGKGVGDYLSEASLETQYINSFNWFAPYIRRITQATNLYFQFSDSVCIDKFNHDTSKRKIGYVTEKYADGGLKVVVFGDEQCYYTQFERYQHVIFGTGTVGYTMDPILPDVTRDDGFQYYPTFGEYSYNQIADPNQSLGTMALGSNVSVSFDDVLDYHCTIPMEANTYPSMHFNWQAGSPYKLTDNLNTTMIFGEGLESQTPFYFSGEQMDDPLVYLQGDLYTLLFSKISQCAGACPASFSDGNAMYNFGVHIGDRINSTNLVATPYNLILTENYNFAQEYLRTGALPPDAYLFPLDWDNLPSWDGNVPTGDEPEDYPDDNNPDDDTRDFDPNPLEEPTFTSNQLTNYNWYWLTVGDWQGFINWFWNDIGDFSDFDDIIAKVKGLYNDLASSVIMCRYYPVDVSWIGGMGTPSNIKLGMIEKNGAVDTLANTSLRGQDIGHIHIGEKYRSFMDLSPYSQLSLYLPFHGFIDLDMNLFNGHDLYVKALYDFVSGTLQYYLYYDNEFLVNTILCKMAMDIPITLQTKNDRDSAIFNNVASTVGGLIGAGVGLASGNPIGMAIGVTQGVSAFNSTNASAPMRLMGNVGENGAYLGPQNCYLVVRRPTIQASNGKKANGDVQTSTKNLSTWKKNVGSLCGYGWKLGVLADEGGGGFTVCQSPRINFTSTTPLQTEVDEIYDYLEKGVIL